MSKAYIPVNITDISGEANKLGWGRYPDGNALKNLSAGLSCHDKIDFQRSDISVPTPWALLVSFDIFLEGDEHNEDNGFGYLQKATLNEWRSLLSLIALKEYYGIENELDKSEVIINSNNSNYDDTNEADKNFFDTIYNLHPGKSIFGGEDMKEVWDKFVILTLKGEPIAVYSPLTLVCSLYSYKNTFATQKLIELGFMDNDYKFKDPIELFKNNMALSLYMYAWLDKLNTCLSNIDSDASHYILNSIESFKKSIELSFQHSANAEEERMYKTLKDNSLFEFDIDKSNNKIDSYEVLKSIKLEKINLRIPALVEKIEIKTDGKPIYLLESLGDGISNLINIFPDKCDMEDCECWDKNTVFYDNMSLIESENGECTIETEENGRKISKRYKYILPIKDDVLMAMNARIVDDNKRIISNEDSIEVSVKFYLNNGDETIISKTYKKSICNIIPENELPTIAIWPYAAFYKEDDEKEQNNIWKEYYVFRAQEKQNEKARITYSIDAKCDMEDTILNYQDLTRMNGEDDIHRSVAHHQKLPTYLSVVKKESLNINRTSEREEKLGIIVLPEDKKITKKISENIKYTVGLDFGTTATTAFCKKEEDVADSEDVKFVKFGTVIGERSNDGLLCTENSYPTSDISGPYVGDENEGCYVAYLNPSIKRKGEPDISFVGKYYPNHKAYSSVYKLNTDVNVENASESLKYGNIIYDQKNLSGLIGRKNSGIIPDLKWGGSDTMGERMVGMALKGFLNQIMKTITFVLCKERVGEIHWRFSYPTALSNDGYEKYKEITDEISKDINKACGVVSGVHGYYPESIASARHFRNEDAQYISIDIGGGSTDVSLWRADPNDKNELENIMQFSVGIASRKIFLAGLTDAIVNPKGIIGKQSYPPNNIQNRIKNLLTEFTEAPGAVKDKMDEVMACVAKAKEIRDIKNDMSNFAHIIELLLQLNGERLRESFNNALDNNSMKQRKKLQEVLVMGLWGILYYTAKSITDLGFKEKLSDVSDLRIKFAGNGSRMCDWLNESTKKNLERAFNSVLDKDRKYTVKFDPIDDKDLKTEAASGMLNLEGDSIEREDIISNDGLVDLDAYILKFKDEDRNDEHYNPQKAAVPQEYREYFNVNGDNKPYEICPNAENNIGKNFGEYLFNLGEILGDGGLINELKEKINSTEFTGNIDNIFKENLNKGTVTPFFILELEALLRTYIGYKCE